MLIWTGLGLVLRTSNYPRLNMWQLLMNIGVVLHGMIVVASSFTDHTIGFVVAQGLVVVGLGGIGLYLQWKHYPSMLVKEPNQDIGILFRFGLGKKVKASDLREHKLDLAKRAASKSTGQRPAALSGSSRPNSSGSCLSQGWEVTEVMVQLMTLHGYAGFAMVGALLLLLIGAWRWRSIQSTRASTPG